MQPNYGCQKGFTYEQLNALENEEGTKNAGVVNSTSRISEAHKRKGDKNSECFVSVHNAAQKKASEVGKKNVKALDGEDIEELIGVEDSTDSWEMMQVDSIDCSDTKPSNEMCFDPEYSWMGSEKSEPWWRMTDRDELVSLVARKSLDRVGNCDLPPPQKTSHRRHPYARVGCFDSKEISASSLDWRTQTGSLSSTGTVRSPGFANSGRTQEIPGCLTKGLSLYESDETSSYCTTHKNMTEIQEDCEGEFSKVQLMEALCHSQTRAREAEKAAKQAYAEKEHIVTLFFRQASLLFAYKQWLQLLQLETLYIQLNNNDQQISNLFPLIIPWKSSCEDRKARKSLHKGVNGRGEKRGRPDHDVAKYAVAFALGLSLVGAGLLLGWTVGWMLPHF